MNKTSAVDFETVLLRLLLDDADLAALVGKKVFALVIPQGTKLPCVTFQRVNGNPQNCLHGHSGLEDIDLVIDVWAHGYAEAKAVAKAVRAAMPPAGDPISSRLQADHDQYEPDEKYFRVSMDYAVSFLES